MRAVVYSGHGIMPELAQVADPACPPDGVVIAVGASARDYPTMMSMVADGTLRPGLLVGRVIGLEDTGRALAAMDGPSEGAGMTVIRFPYG